MIGTHVGQYKVLDKLGEGGMGAVYRARDTRLNRDVALKLLPAALAGDADRLARFRREAQVLAALNHPNIAQIYGLEDVPPAPPALVMELVSGRTLDDVIRGGAVPWADVLPIARQIAEALENAHERGIVHRDLKPANIKLRDDGTVKVLDFGLAKALSQEEGDGSDSAAATVTSPALTEAGVILGTAAYMAPEQARGRAVDKRADIWAYGVVLFELLVGRKLFAGESVTETIAAVIKDDLKLDRLPVDVPTPIRALIARCLERDPARRLRDIGEARILLADPLARASGAHESGRERQAGPRRGWLIPAAAAILLATATGFGAWWLKPAPAEMPLRRLELALPAGADDVALSRDGSRLAYLVDDRLYVRRLDELEAKEIGRLHITAQQLVWSPDDRTIVFTAEGAIRSIPAEGGPLFDICRVPASGRVMSLAVRSDGQLVFSVWRENLYIVPATGGTPTVHVAIDPAAEIDFHQIAPLPDRRLIVATHKRQEDSDVIELIDPAGGTRVRLTDDRSVGRFEYVDPGRLLFRRTATNAGIWTMPFREGAIDVNQASLVQAGASDYSVARDGTLVALIPARTRESLVWVDLNGVESRAPGTDVESPDTSVELSPDGRRAAFVVGTWAGISATAGSLNNGIVIVRDLTTGADTRLVIGPSASSMWEDTGSPTWSPDGHRIIHRTGRVESNNLIERRADVAGAGRTLTQGFLGRLMPDGRTLIYSRDVRGAGVIEQTVIDPNGRVEPGRPLFPEDPQPNARDFELSSDGRLIAYVVVQANRRTDVFLARIASPAERWLIQEGGNRPRFTNEGRELLFVRGAGSTQGPPQGELVKVSIGSGPAMALGAPTVVLRDAPGGPRISTYDVSPDGRRVLMWKPVPVAPGQGERFVLVLNGLTPRQ